METIQDFVARTGVSMTATPSPSNPNAAGDWHAKAFHFHCTVTRDGESLSTYYSVGPGIVESWAREHGPKRGAGSHGWRTTREHFIKRPRTLDGAAYFDSVKDQFRPDIADLLDCLAMESDVFGYESFEDWAESFGYDTDSRKAEATYKACQTIARDLRRVLGRDDFESLVHNVERL